MGVEWVGALFSGVTSLLSRIDRREDNLQERQDLLEPLLDLYHLIAAWDTFAASTNEALEEYLYRIDPSTYNQLYSDREPSDVEMKLFRLATSQMVRASDVLERAGFNNPSRSTNGPEFRERLSLSDLIAIYAPELKEQFRQVSEVRIEQLQRLRSLTSPDVEDETERQRTEETIEDALRSLTDNPPVSINRDITQQVLEEFNESRLLLSKLRDTLAKFIAENWSPKDATLTRKSVSHFYD